MFWLKQKIRSTGHIVWNTSPNKCGIGISLDWPIEGWEEKADKLKKLLTKHEDSYTIEGPTWAAGGTLVIYVWPKEKE